MQQCIHIHRLQSVAWHSYSLKQQRLDHMFCVRDYITQEERLVPQRTQSVGLCHSRLLLFFFFFQYNQSWTSLPSIMLSRIRYAGCGAWSFEDYWTVIPVHLQLLVPLTLDSWLRLAELSICFVTIRAKTQVLVVDVGTENRWSSSAENGPGLGNS